MPCHAVFATLKAKHGFLLVLDEAHATLVCGSTDGGAAEEMGVKPAVSMCVMPHIPSPAGTCDASVWQHGRGSSRRDGAPLRDFFASRGRSFIFSTALPVPVVAAARAALAVAGEERWRQRAVWWRVKQLGQGLGVTFTSPICPIVLGSADLALQASRHLLLSGFHVPAIRPPTVAPGSSRFAELLVTSDLIVLSYHHLSLIIFSLPSSPPPPLPLSVPSPLPLTFPPYPLPSPTHLLSLSPSLRVALSASHTPAHVNALITALRPILALSRSHSRTTLSHAVPPALPSPSPPPPSSSPALQAHCKQKQQQQLREGQEGWEAQQGQGAKNGTSKKGACRSEL
ncbi:unnamed protein product [Closterium sp. Naga37s-1]|nr:unnamed protein product [Closterium sp. Naga37s-1]